MDASAAPTKTEKETEKEKKQRRASKPKVKTGCNNCKNRRVKCDETRPQCQKCVKSGRRCDGYPAYNPRRDGARPDFVTRILPAPAIKPRDSNPSNSYRSYSISSRSSSSGSSASPPRIPPTAVVRRRPERPEIPERPEGSERPERPDAIRFSPMHAAPSISLAFDSQESLYFRLFREHTANELSGFFDSGFWTRSVLQESHSEASIRHAVVALGALYKTLEKASESPPGSPDSDNWEDTAPDHYNFALQQYGKSLKRLREALEGRETRSPRTVLISIVLFTCFQSFIGDHKNAILQIQAGLGLLEERRAEQRQPQMLQSPPVLEDELVQMFTRLAVQAKSYDMAFHFPAPYVIRLNPSGFPSSPSDPSSPSSISSGPSEPSIPECFETLQEARTSLDSLTERIMCFSEALSTFYGGPSNILPTFIRHSGQAFRASLESWSKAFEPLLESRRNIGITNTQRAGINVCKMMQLMTAILFWTGFSLSEMNFDAFTPEFRFVVELAKEIVVDEELSLAAKRCGSLTKCRHHQPSYHQSLPAPFSDEDAFNHIKPSFALDLGIVPPLFVVATKCRDRKLRREAIRLLVSSPRREGMWDSILSGRAALWIMEIEEEDLPPYHPWTADQDLDSADALPPDDKRVMVKEILFDLQKHQATLRCGTRGLQDASVADARARETFITW
ncbi:hypothetical protein BP6252_00471 [Coleophoma cylindrospora]|uniref:Zn(2)-C6 fungal-type domain-containing protein n=1 Tax=Coleophoma cylindrospora TaxID=1849047 RepID=A0A3D8SQ38_9HELO|nr:hypothetical protein BP6252_00471 [Coleophoma cylindrospora]